MALINVTSKKNFYNRSQDEQVVALKKEGKTAQEIAAVVGHTPASIAYRINRVLSKNNNFDTIKYKGAAAIAAVAPAAPVAAKTAKKAKGAKVAKN